MVLLTPLPISGLPQAPELLPTDEFAIETLGITRKSNGQQMIDMINDKVALPTVIPGSNLINPSGDPNVALFNQSFGIFVRPRFSNDADQRFGNVLVPAGVDPSRPCKVSYILSPNNPGVSTIHFQMQYDIAPLGGSDTGITNQTVILTTNGIFNSPQATPTFDIPTTSPNDSIYFRLNFLATLSTYTGSVDFGYVIFDFPYL